MDANKTTQPIANGAPFVGRRRTDSDQAGQPLAPETLEFLEILSQLTPEERAIVLTTGRVLLSVRNKPIPEFPSPK